MPPCLSPGALAARLEGAVVIGRTEGLALFDGVTKAEAPALAAGARSLVVVGGGTRIDAAKAWRAHQAPEVALIAVATRFGSGAEANGIAVLDSQGVKTIHVGPEYAPDARAYLPETLQTLTPEEVLWSCGDALTHAVEGLLSPLATEALRADLADVITKMLTLGAVADPAWFELSARASFGQSQASVGAVHGLAHVLEGACFQAKQGRNYPGHTRLCAAFLAPVLRYNLAASSKAAERLAAQGLDAARLLEFADHLSGPALDARIDWETVITDNWKAILRDPCTRTNVALVRPAALPALLEHLPR